MKAVVVELKDDIAAVLSDDGCVETIKNNNYEIGQIIQTKNPGIQFTRKIRIFAASAAAVFVILGAGTWAYASPYMYVSMDVNPSIEFSVNRFDRVLRAKAVNEDGEDILDKISFGDLKNKTIEEALTASVEQISESGYFDGDTESGIVIATSCKDMEKAEELAQELQQTVEKEVTQNGDDVEVEVFSVGLSQVKEAKDLGVTPGKLNLVEKLQEAAADPDSVSIEEWLDKPVKDIMKATKDYKNSSKDSNASSSIEVNDNKATDQDTKRNKTAADTSNSQTATKDKPSKSDQSADVSNGTSDESAKKSETSNQPTSVNTVKASKKNTQGAAVSKKEAESSNTNPSNKTAKSNNSSKAAESSKPKGGTSTENASPDAVNSTSDDANKSTGKSLQVTEEVNDATENKNDASDNTNKSENNKTQNGTAANTENQSEGKKSDSGSNSDTDNKPDLNNKANDKTDTGASPNSSGTENNSESHGSKK